MVMLFLQKQNSTKKTLFAHFGTNCVQSFVEDRKYVTGRVHCSENTVVKFEIKPDKATRKFYGKRDEKPGPLEFLVSGPEVRKKEEPLFNSNTSFNDTYPGLQIKEAMSNLLRQGEIPLSFSNNMNMKY
eukprot:GHVP01067801.1.p1 GENE.GHVP01067801.1~~GHVP01067801.1.p1  ORF type:complete len:129 (-),score=23.39 GHVP01067801.1:173-559(-)